MLHISISVHFDNTPICMSQVDIITIASKQKKSADWSDVSIGIYSDIMRNFLKCVSLLGFLENCIIARVQHINKHAFQLF